MTDWYWEEAPGIRSKVYQKPGTVFPYGAVYEEPDHGYYADIVRCYPEPHVRLSNFPTSAEAEAVVEAVMPIYCMERGYE